MQWKIKRHEEHIHEEEKAEEEAPFEEEEV